LPEHTAAGCSAVQLPKGPLASQEPSRVALGML
jgi:hypothetical protein